MATCANCGSDNPEGSKFCGACGKPLEAAEPAAEETAAPPPSDPAGAPTEVQPGYTPQHAAYNEALAAINAPASTGTPTSEQPSAPTEQQPATESPTAQQPPVTTTPPVPPIPVTPTPPATMPPASGPGGGSNKKVIFGVIGGLLALIAIVAAVWFFVLRDDEAEPAVAEDAPSIEETESTEEETTDDTPPPADAGAGAFDSIEPLIAQSAGPYSITQQSSEPCQPPCIFPDGAHVGSIETMQATWDAGSPESEIYGEFLLYPSEAEALGGVDQTIAFLEQSGYGEIDTFSINGVPGTVYQSADAEVLLYQESNLMMGLFGNKGYPIEFVGYLGP